MNIEERHLVYVKALKEFKKFKIGICHSLDRAMKVLVLNKVLSKESVTTDEKNVYRSFYERLEDVFPEVIKHKPSGSDYKTVWFPYDDGGNQQRILILEQAIKETNPKNV